MGRVTRSLVNSQYLVRRRRRRGGGGGGGFVNMDFGECVPHEMGSLYL
jgi:hypothetical protein